MNSSTFTDRKKYYDDLVKNLNKIGEYGVPYESNTELTQLPVYEIPIGEDFETGLRFNLDNSRIMKYVIAEEQKLGKKIDPEKPETQKFIHNVLFNSNLYTKDAMKTLQNDLDSIGQQDPVIISCDGTIWNGNRRISIMKKMYKDTRDPKWANVNGVFLPALNKKTLKQLEHRLQIARTFKEEYDRLTLLLDCRKRHRDEGWTVEELEDSFKGRYKAKKIEAFIKQIDLIDEYLLRIDQVGNYPILDRKGAEFFESVLTHLEKEKNKIGTSPVDISKITTEFFVLHKGRDTTYMDARQLGEILSNQPTRVSYLKNSPIYNNYAEYTKPDQNGLEKAFSPNIVNDTVLRVKSTHAELVASTGDTPLLLAEAALKKLDDIKEEDIEFNDNKFLAKINQIKSRLDSLRSYVQDD